MSDPSAGIGATPPALPAAHPPFPFPRLLWAIGYGFIAWIVFWLVLVLAVIQFVMVAINGHVHEELKTFSQSLRRYLGELLAYIVFASDQQPFPVGPFPKAE